MEPWGGTRLSRWCNQSHTEQSPLRTASQWFLCVQGGHLLSLLLSRYPVTVCWVDEPSSFFPSRCPHTAGLR